MNLSKDTLAILKNFSGINSNLSIKPGQTLTTMSSGRNIIAQAVVEEEFPIAFGIYDLNGFLGALSLFDSPDIEFSEKFAKISQDKNSIKYYAASPSVLTQMPTIKQFPTPDIEFDLTGAMMTQIHRVSSILHVPDFSIVGDSSTIKLVVGDKSNPTGNVFQSEIATTDKTFNINMKVENLKMMVGDYKVSVGGKKICRFQSASQQLVYYCAVELDSTFEF